MAQKNTLFNYFTKSPSQNKVSNGTPAEKNEKKPGKDSKSTTPSGKKSAGRETKTKTPSVKKSVSKRILEKEFQLFDVVWSKLDGYPWWPSLICNHPKLNNYIRKDDIHVQFFDNPPTRAWIRAKYVEKYENNLQKLAPVKDKDKWKLACQEADVALKTTSEERSKLIIDFPDESDSEDPEDETDALEENDEEMNKENQEVQNDDKSPPQKRRRILVLDSEDSEDEYKPKKEELESESDSASSGVESGNELEAEVDEPDETPEKKRKRTTNSGRSKRARKDESELTPVNSATKEKLSSFPSLENSGAKDVKNALDALRSPSIKEATKARLSLFSVKENSERKSADVGNNESWPHLKFEFLQPHKIRDANRRPPSDPNYDPKTLYVPEDFKKNLTPALRQWWEMKAAHYDCVLFFKVGKFYELYHMDAVTGVNELGLTYMKGDNAHSGFPEIAYGRFSSSLIEKGYKVARVEQTETPDMMGERCKGMSKVTKFDKVVKREICQITTKGTRVYSVIDGDVKDAESNYLLALTEKAVGDKTWYGVCFIDTSIGVFHLGQFMDDRHCSRLRTLLAHHPPVQVLYEKRALSEKTQQLLNSSLSSVLKDALASETEFWTAQKTLTELAEGGYFSSEGSGVTWPPGLQPFLNQADSLSLSADSNGELAIRALGACTWYLKSCYLEQQLLSMGRFEQYVPQDHQDEDRITKSSNTSSFSKYMVLDGITLNNLDILENGTGSKEGTLIHKLDQCCTPFGKRLLRQWMCNPLCDMSGIKARQEAVSWLKNHSDVVSEVRPLLSQLPDLERLLSKIHAQGNPLKSKSHPDSRAIMFEDHTYSKKRIMEFLSTLSGFKTVQKVASMFEVKYESMSSKLLVQCTCSKEKDPSGRFPDISKALQFFETAFDHEEAKELGRINPSKGVDPEYDSVMEELKQIKKDLNDYLESQKKYFGCKVTYVGSDKKRFQLEVSESACKKAGSDYELQGQRKGFKRYWTQETKELLSRQMAAEEQEKNVLKDLNRRIFAKFSSDYEVWNTAVQCLSVLDVLMAFSEYARSEVMTCIPQFELPAADVQPFIDIKEGRHPCLSSLDDFIPNDTTIGSKDGNTASLVLVTGPNMGGKSTLMRQVGLLVVMAQLGCHVPAAECNLTPVDRIFTRLGANDDIMAGESTFFVELSETAAILHHATQHSLVLVDELGRGTSTYDGTAIAASVVQELSSMRCRTLFSTHYHTLVEDFRNSPQITLGHMACMVENENEEDPSEETVTFLYKFVDGACPKSYGFNAARLAGIPAHIIRTGYNKAVQLEKEGEKRKLFQQIFGKKNCSLGMSSLLSMARTVI